MSDLYIKEDVGTNFICVRKNCVEAVERSFLMKSLFRISLTITALVVFNNLSAYVIPYIGIRSQGFNAERELVGWQSMINRFDMCDIYGSFSITPEYTRSFRSADIADALFCDAIVNTCSDSVCSTFLVQGTKVPDRDPRALLAENFYLPTDFSSNVTIQPIIDNVLIDFNFYLGLDEWADGLYFRIHSPICHTRWDLNYCENVVTPGKNNYDIGYFNDIIEFVGGVPSYGINRSKLLKSFREYIVDCQTIKGVPRIICNSLEHARISSCPLTRTRLAELTVAFGWNLINCQDYAFGIQVRGAAPTGNSPEACYLFEPIVGNGHHWELGCGIDSRWCTWRSEDEEDDFSIYLDANVSHLFKTRQCRFFDLKCKPLSRYMLAMKFTGTTDNLLAGDTVAGAIAPSYQFDKEYMPVANLTTIPVNVSAAAQGDIALKLAYTHCNFQWDFGYGFWGRTCFDIEKRCDCCSNNFAENTWVLKGDSFMYGFTGGTAADMPGVALSASQNEATIFNGLNSYPEGITLGTTHYNWNQNPGIDNPKLAWNGSNVALNTFGAAGGLEQVLTSLQPKFITEQDFDLEGAQTSAYSNKVFTHFSYIWRDREEWVPYLGVGAEVEFGHTDSRFCTGTCGTCCPTTNAVSRPSVCCSSTATSDGNCCTKTCCCPTVCDNKCCKSFAISQWGVWIKGGVSFE